MITNTCAFDSVVHSLLVSYHDWLNYHDYVNNNCNVNEILDFIKMVPMHGASKKIYKERAIILTKIFQSANGSLNCASNISELIRSLMQNIPSYNITKQCSVCNWEHQQTFIITEINTQPIYQCGMRGLQEVLNQIVNSVSRKCNRCSNENINLNFILGPHLFIDTECLLWTELAHRFGYKDWSGNITLSEIPSEVKLITPITD